MWLHSYDGYPGLSPQGTPRFFETDNTAGIQAKHAARLRLILGRLSVSVEPRDMALPGLDFHQLRGKRAGTWAVKVSGNWRVTFTFVDKDADAVDYEDYH
ncbi:MAG TPA: type II toxin-antitoxin system RelE/ParE family toxin [Vicinamibacterales bacterium]|nr:type II toxin-antitoxin system RelE/ParE family toxin [Vicinamibacterales bacterium]